MRRVGAELMRAAGDRPHHQPGDLLPGLVGDRVERDRVIGAAFAMLARRACARAVLLAREEGRDTAVVSAAARRRRPPSRASRVSRALKASPRNAAAVRVRATTSTPDVSRSSRCTSRGLRPCRSVKASSIASTCRVTPEPPCTARPAGLFSTMTSASSCRIAGLEHLAVAASADRGRRALAGVAGAASGGTRTSWPAASRVEVFDARAVHPHLAGADQLLQMRRSRGPG